VPKSAKPKSTKQSTYDLCVGLLGKDLDEIVHLCEKLDLEPEVELKPGIHLYTFPEYGLLFLYFELFGYFSSVHFFVDTPAVKEGYVQPYTQPFINDISGNDCKEEVELKMGFVPKRFERTGCYWEVYELERSTVEFIFDPATGHMLSVTVKHKEKST